MGTYKSTFFSNLVEKNSLIVSKCRENGIDRLRNGKLRRRRQGQRRLKMDLYFTNESRDTLKSFLLFITVKIIPKLNPEHRGKFEIKILKLSCRGSRSTDNATFGHLTLFIYRGRQRNVPRLQRTCTATVLLINSFVR